MTGPLSSGLGSSRSADSRLTGLLSAARGGSKEALGTLFESYRDYLLLVANHELASDILPKAAPSDLVQQTLTEACQHFPRFEGTSDAELLVWLRKILLNNIKDVTRGFRATAKRDVRREVPLASDGTGIQAIQYLASGDPSPSAYVATCEEQARLNSALQRMPAHYAEVIRLRNLDYLSFPEIAVILETTADGARKLWERAIERLTRELDSSDDKS
jgi:RNA polymerase sigma-70 factor (ECF subfamily)